MNTRLCAAALLALPALAGCGGSSSSSTSAPTLTPRSVSAPLSNGLTGTLTENRLTVSVGGTVTYTLTLSNATAQPITYQPLISPDLMVQDPSGNLINPTFTNLVGIGPSTTLAPGQSARYDMEVIGGSNGNGSYSVTGQYNATGSFGVRQSGTATSPGIDIFAAAGPLPITVQ